MASMAQSRYLPPSPPATKKRALGDLGPEPVRPPKKRLQLLSLPPKLSGSAHRHTLSISKSAAEPSGLEGHLKLDADFVEASEATEKDETKRSVQVSTDSGYRALLVERRLLSTKIRSSWPAGMGTGRGLKNLNGVLCYRHSLFQALLHTPKFVFWIKYFHKPQDCVSDNPSKCVSCQIRNLVLVYWNKDWRTSSVWAQLVTIHELFQKRGWKTHSENEHGDPDEQFAWILEIMRTEMPSSVFSYFDAFSNSILESEIKCGKCGHISRTQGNNERNLSIPIRVLDIPGCHLQLFLKAYMDEVISGYRCENETCKHVSSIHRIQKFAYAPDVLLIQLKRFNSRGNKDYGKVQYGARLDLSPHSASESLGPLGYDLIAVISHSGNAGFGHYQCISKTPDGDWWQFNDVYTTRVTIKEALNPAIIDRDWTPYLLFYERNEASMPPL